MSKSEEIYALPRRAELVVCDDVRIEASGKQIFIGVYGAEIQFPVFPNIYPQLFFVFTVRGQLDELPPQSIAFEVHFPGADKDFPRVELDSDDFASLRNSDNEANYYFVQVMFRVAPARFDKPGTLSVVMYDEYGEHLVGRLKITENPALVPPDQLELLKRRAERLKNQMSVAAPPEKQ